MSDSLVRESNTSVSLARSSTLPPPVQRMMYTASIKNGNPNPSFAPASAEMISLKGRATNLSANGPLAMACERTGSVHATQDAMTKAERTVTLGTVAITQSVVQIHMIVMIGSRQSAISRQRVRQYRAGS